MTNFLHLLVNGQPKLQEGAYCPVKAINLQDCQEMKRGLQGAQLPIRTQVCVHNLAFWQTLKKVLRGLP